MNRMHTYKWIAVGNTQLLMQLQNRGEIPEWHPVAQVTLRQIYAAVPPRYYAWQIGQERDASRSGAMEEAKALIEAQMKITTDRSEPTPAARQP